MKLFHSSVLTKLNNDSVKVATSSFAATLSPGQAEVMKQSQSAHSTCESHSSQTSVLCGAKKKRKEKESLSLRVCKEAATDGLKKTWVEKGKDLPAHCLATWGYRNAKSWNSFFPLTQFPSQLCLRGNRCPGTIVLIYAAASRAWCMLAVPWTGCAQLLLLPSD